MLLTNKIYEGNLFMRYSKHLTYAERMFLRARLNRVRHITLDPDGPGVVRIHLVPCHKPDRETPFTAILNGQDILPLNVSWAILLTNFIEALKPYTGKEIRPEEWSAINAQAVAATRKIYRKTEYAQIESDLKTLVDCLCTIARGGTPRSPSLPATSAGHRSRRAFAPGPGRSSPEASPAGIVLPDPPATCYNSFHAASGSQRWNIRSQCKWYH